MSAPEVTVAVLALGRACDVAEAPIAEGGGLVTKFSLAARAVIVLSPEGLRAALDQAFLAGRAHGSAGYLRLGNGAAHKPTDGGAG